MTRRNFTIKQTWVDNRKKWIFENYFLAFKRKRTILIFLRFIAVYNLEIEFQIDRLLTQSKRQLKILLIEAQRYKYSRKRTSDDKVMNF